MEPSDELGCTQNLIQCRGHLGGQLGYYFGDAA